MSNREEFFVEFLFSDYTFFAYRWIVFIRVRIMGPLTFVARSHSSFISATLTTFGTSVAQTSHSLVTEVCSICGDRAARPAV